MATIPCHHWWPRVWESLFLSPSGTKVERHYKQQWMLSLSQTRPTSCICIQPQCFGTLFLYTGHNPTTLKGSWWGVSICASRLIVPLCYYCPIQLAAFYPADKAPNPALCPVWALWLYLSTMVSWPFVYLIWSLSERSILDFIWCLDIISSPYCLVGHKSSNVHEVPFHSGCGHFLGIPTCYFPIRRMCSSHMGITFYIYGIL